MNALNPKHIGMSLSATMSIVYATCTLLVAIVPQSALVVFYKNMYHGIDVTTIIGNAPTIGGFLIGLLSVAISSWLIGALFAAIYNRLTRQPE
jgi:hypothetical protein